MKQRTLVLVMLFAVILMTSSVFSVTAAEKKPPETVSIKLEGGKLPPVNFSHTTHVEKNKLDCVTCHHKDKDPKAPEACVKCHLVTEVKDNAPMAKDAFHKQCQNCHKESTAKGVKAPTACNECHKK